MTELWTEKYRPKTIDEAILPKELKTRLQSIVSSGELPNLLLSGPPGGGKTTIARAICSQLGLDWILINGSDERNIDVLRNKVRQFASTISFTDGPKVIILDEADYLNPTSTQPALRGFIEEFAGNARFFLTCNHKGKILEAIHSRCVEVDVRPGKELPELSAQFYKRLVQILKAENVQFLPKAIMELIGEKAPDWRSILGACQHYAASGSIDEGVLKSLNDESMKALVSAMAGKRFKDVRKWVVDNLDADPTTIFRRLYDSAFDVVEPASVPQLVLILADYDYKRAFVSDQEINMVACLTEIMAGVKFK
jgi:DNA polymerase III delta prime subunit